MSEGAVKGSPVWGALGAVMLVAASSVPAQAQRDRSGDGEVQRLIDQLSPGSATRGIRVPAEPAPARPAAGPSQDRVAAPTARPVAPSRPTTTAPPGVPAASLTVLFATGSATLTPQAERELATLGRALTSQQLVTYRFRIEGHTDTVGSRESNQALSERRAAAVREFLIQRFGVPAERLEAIGVGEDQLLVGTPDETPERRNRRVQVVNLGT
jgi:outer membrane protein OmpA-like peptidoglycan-associated protein